MSQIIVATETFADQVRAVPGGEHLEVCYSCGTCVSKCMIQRKVEPAYNPRRLLRLVMTDRREEAFRSPTTWHCSACDLCYPACPQQIHISGVIGAVKQLAVAAGYTSPLETVSVDEWLCAGCGTCVAICPYEAPSLVGRKFIGQQDPVAQVDPNRCMGCGICVAVCPSGAIAHQGVSNQEILTLIDDAMQDDAPQRPAIFICDWHPRADADLTLLERPPGVVTSETLADQVRAIPGGEHLGMCYTCGTCVSKCMVQQKVEPEYNPRRLLQLVMIDRREEAFRSPTTWHCSACDLCYPACPQQIHISGVIGAVKQLAVEAGYTSPLETVSVDESLCAGCGICGMACPYEAPSLVEKQVNDQMDRVAEVDGEKCMGCGICVAACPLGAIARPGVSNQEIKAQIDIAEPVNGAPRLLVFVCDWCLRADADVQLLESYPENVRVIHIPCAGRIDPEMALLALRAGIDGVLVCGCQPGECHYQRGASVSACKLGLLDRVLDQMKAVSATAAPETPSPTGNGLAGGRVRLVQIGTQERGRIRREVDAMLEHLVACQEAGG